jgi:uncharacterized protein (DUF58 family)
MAPPAEERPPRRSAVGIGVLGAVVLLAGFLLDGEPLLVAGSTLVLLAAGCLIWVVLAVRGLEVTRQVGERRVVEDEPLEVIIRVRGRLPWPGGEVRESLLPEPAPLPLMDRNARVRIAVRFHRRGMRDLPPPTAVVSDPLGLASRHVTAVEGAQVLVLPRTFPVVAAGLAPGDGRAVGLEALAAGAAATEFDGLAPYREGAPAARIHWPAFARGAGLLERRLRPEGDARPLVLLDSRAPASEAFLDAAVRAAASLGLELARSGGCALLLPGERRPRPVEPDMAGWPAVHARLAMVGPGPAPALGALGSRRGPILYVAARPLSRPPAAVARGVAGRCVLVTPGEAGARPAGRTLFTVAGCTGVIARGRAREGAAA